MLLSYIDPGIISLAVQAAFVAVFGALTAYALAPWRFLRSLLGRFRAPESSPDGELQRDEADAQP